MMRATRFDCLVLSVGVMLLGLVAMGGTSLAQAPITIETDKQSYIFPADLTATVTVTGLTACVGQTVEVAFFSDSIEAPHEFTLTGEVVGANGRIVATLRIPEGASSSYFAGVRAPCLPGGGVLDDSAVGLAHGDPPFGPRFPPGPLPEGVSVEVDRTTITTGSSPAFRVVVSGLSRCAGYSVVVHLERVPPFDQAGGEFGEQVLVDEDGIARSLFLIRFIRPGSYFVWVRGICSGTFEGQQIIEVLSSPGPAEPGPPDPPPAGNSPAERGGEGSASAVATTLVGLSLLVAGAFIWLRPRS